MTNQSIIDLIEENSRGVFSGNLEKTLKYIERLLVFSGSNTRYWTNEDEKAIDLIDSAICEAAEQAEIGLGSIDLLIYVGVGKGFQEPGQSYLVAHALGMDHVECFDLLDACMSWSRAMFLADTMLRAGKYKHILVVTGEFNVYEGSPGYPANYTLENREKLEWTFPSYTIGCAATATIVTADPENDWKWAFTSSPNQAELCTIPTPHSKQYSRGSDRIGKNGPMMFTSYGMELHKYGHEGVISVFNKLGADPESIKVIFPHASSSRAWTASAKVLGIEEKLFHIYPEWGNIVSSSVPAAIAEAHSQGAIQRGDQLAGWVASAGMSYAAYTFTF